MRVLRLAINAGKLDEALQPDPGLASVTVSASLWQRGFALGSLFKGKNLVNMCIPHSNSDAVLGSGWKFWVQHQKWRESSIFDWTTKQIWGNKKLNSIELRQEEKMIQWKRQHSEASTKSHQSLDPTHYAYKILSSQAHIHGSISFQHYQDAAHYRCTPG